MGNMKNGQNGQSSRSRKKARSKIMPVVLAVVMVMTLCISPLPGMSFAAATAGIQPLAATVTVTNNNDGGAGSLRQAIADVDDGGTINFTAGMAGRTINLSSQLLISGKSVTINGNGVTLNGSGIFSGDTSKILCVDVAGKTVTLNRLRFNNGTPTDYGGALRHDAGTLNLVSCIFSNNQITGVNSFGGAIYNQAILNVRGCTFYNNTGYLGGAIYNNSAGTLTLVGNIFFGNNAPGISNVVYSGSTVISGGYNVSDMASGTNNTTGSGYTFTTGDIQISQLSFDTTSFAPALPSVCIVQSGVTGFPTTDFYGTARISPGGAAGAVEYSAVSVKAITSFTLAGVAGTINQSTGTIAVTLPYGTAVTSLIPAIVHTGASISPLATTAQDFSSPVSYTVTAADSTTKQYTVMVTVASNPANKAITSFTLAGVAGTINEDAGTIAVTLPYGTSVTSLTPTIVHTGASINPLATIARNFTNPVTYTVTAVDTSTKQYIVTVTVLPNPAKAITSFTLAGVSGTINEGAGTIAVTLPYGTVVTSLTPTIVHTGASISPLATAAQDFSTTVTYTVTAADSTTKQYTVTVTVMSPLIVTNANDSGVGSLRQAIADAGDGDTIIFDASMANATINLGSQLLISGKSVTINGNGVTLNGSGITLGNDSQILRVGASGKTVTLRGLHFKNGAASDYGGAIRHSVGTLNLESCIFSNNQTTLANSWGGAVCNSATMNLRGCTFYNNSTAGRGGAIYNNSGTLTLTGNIFFGNTATYADNVVSDSGATTSYGYNVSDMASGTSAATGSGYTFVAGDVQEATLPFNTTTFAPALSSVCIVPSGVTSFPTTDFYGTARVSPGGAAGAVEYPGAKAITSFTLAGVAGTINEGAGTIAVTVPYGTAVTSLAPTIVHTGASVSPLAAAAQNFSSPVTYTVTAVDTSTKQYIVTVTVAANPAKAITGFTLAGVAGTINEGAGTIAVTVPYGTTITNLAPTIVHTGASISPLAAAAQNFSSPVTYTVTAADSTTKLYAVTVTIAPNPAKAITSFTLAGVTGTINEGAGTIAVTVPYGTTVASLTPTIVHTGASISPTGAQNFSGPVTYTVTAADSTTKTYTVTVTIAPAPIPIVVTNSNNSGAGSLREAISDAGDGGTITFAPAMAGASINLTARLEITKSVTIAANGITLDGSGIPEDPASRILGIYAADKTITLSGLHFKNGTVSNFGGAIYHNAGTLNLESCIFNNNQTTDTYAMGGAIFNNAVLNIRGCTFYHNSTPYWGGAIYNGGGGILTLSGNVFFGNTAPGKGNVISNVNTVISGGYNASDKASGTDGTTGSGFTFVTGDVQISTLTFDTTSFAPTQSSICIVPSGVTGFPTTDFYGTTRVSPGGAAGAVEYPGVSTKAITSFTLAGVAGTINEGAGTIAVTVPYGTAVTSLAPTIVHTGASISPLATAAQNFTCPVVYTVTAANGTTKQYTVTVTVAPSTLVFADNAAYDIPASMVSTAITSINVSGGVSGGTAPYKFSATGLPAGIAIGATGVISGTPTAATPAGTATITVTDKLGANRSITINYGAITAAPGGGDTPGGDTPGGGSLVVTKDKDGTPLLVEEPSSAKPLDLAHFTEGSSITVDNIAWTGKQIKSGMKVKVSYKVGGKLTSRTLTAGKDYTITGFGANKNIGKGTLTIKGAGAFKGTKALTFKIVPKAPTKLKVKAAKKSAKVTFTKVNKAQKITTYKVEYRIKGTAKWKSKVVKVKLKGKTAKQKTASVTLKKLTSKKTYEIRVYAYKGVYAGLPTSVKKVIAK